MRSIHHARMQTGRSVFSIGSLKIFRRLFQGRKMRSIFKHHFEEDFGGSKIHLVMLKLILEALLAPHRNSVGGLLGPKWRFRRAVFSHPYRGFALSSEKDAFQRISKIRWNSHAFQNAQKRPKTNLSENQRPILAQHRLQKGLQNRWKFNEFLMQFFNEKCKIPNTLKKIDAFC